MRVEPGSVVRDLEDDAALLAREADRDPARTRVLHDVGQRLLEDAEEQQLDRRDEPHPGIGALDPHLEARRLPVFRGGRFDRGEGSEVVEHGRMEEMGHLPHPVHHVEHLRTDVPDAGAQCPHIAAETALEQGELKLDRHERLARAVV